MHSYRVYSFLHVTVNLTQAWVPALMVNLFLCLDCHRGIIPWDFRMLTTARSLPYLCTSLLWLGQVNSAPSLLSELPTPACAPLAAERSSTAQTLQGEALPSRVQWGLSASISIPTEPNAAWTEWAKPPTAIRGEGRLLSPSRLHRASSHSNSKQLPCYGRGMRSCSPSAEWNGWNPLTLFLQEVRLWS